ncbi:hypothetical protein WJX81_001019 [Elliptochloris bilobata]|uniref:Uncharacterized protein n=1 Tax=Elliptochloris bilobata TaxID=381761 RepID=A0AAW1S0U0_9CHLO
MPRGGNSQDALPGGSPRVGSAPLTRAVREHASRKLRSGTTLPSAGGPEELGGLRVPTAALHGAQSPRSPRSTPRLAQGTTRAGREACSRSPATAPLLQPSEWEAGDGGAAQAPMGRMLSLSAGSVGVKSPRLAPTKLPEAAGSLHGPVPRTPRSARMAGASPTSPSSRRTRSDAEAARLQEDEEARAEARDAEDALLERAAGIMRARDSAARQLPPSQEPKRGKAHWDFVMDEMAWMAKEFQRERQWKLKQGRKFARAVARSNLNIETRAILREREAQAALHRRAAWIAREVMRFWGKAERVVAFKRQQATEALKKEAMDKHLSFLLGQTQRYSCLLAQRLAPGSEEAAPQALGLPAAGGSSAGTAAREGADAAQERDGGAHVGPDAGEPEEGRSDGEEEAEVEAEEEDDEATLEEEEALAREAGEGGREAEGEEAAALADEADMPIEQLLARYGITRDDGKAPAAAAPALGAGDGAERPAKRRRADLRESADAPPLLAAADAQHAATAEQPGEADAGEAGGGEYMPGGSDDGGSQDDEATLEEEDDLAAADADAHQAAVADEVAALADEATMPIEELMACYRMRGSANSSPAADAEHDDREPRPSPSSDDAANAAGAGEDDTPGLAASAVPPAPAAAGPPATGAASAEATETAAPAAGPAEDDAEPMEVAGASLEGARARLEGVAALASSIQPTGSTLETANKVLTRVPFLLKGSLREYQHIGLDWLTTIYTRRLNGILADEMGLGKTIMTIALLAHLACEKGVWGPHLIVVPTSVMLNWEMECKKWCPAFKLLTYFGSAKERKAKRQGWSKPNAFHVCITSYTLVLQDAKMFRRKKWKYLILDEAHMIKNWKSQRWQTLLNFNSQRRLLITGTPLQNDLMELWSLMHFLMPQVFASHAQFKDWFSNPLSGMVEGQSELNQGVVERLHSVLRPFLLRRLKSDVEKGLPGKHEHVVRCRLSKRQRTLYEEYMASSDTASTLASGNFLGIINVLMQLRKVCNHPDLFEGRPIVSAFDMPGLVAQLPSRALRALDAGTFERFDAASLGLRLEYGMGMAAWEAQTVQALAPSVALLEEPDPAASERPANINGDDFNGVSLEESLPFVPGADVLAAVAAALQALRERRRAAAAGRQRLVAAQSAARCAVVPLLGRDALAAVRVLHPAEHVHTIAQEPGGYFRHTAALAELVRSNERRASELDPLVRAFMFVIPQARAPAPAVWCSRPDSSAVAEAARRAALAQREFAGRSAALRTAIVRQQLFFPDRRLIQYDCGKLQELAVLLRRLRAGGHKALIFTQMTRMLDVLEAFLNLHGHTYLRLDGSTKPEMRQVLMQRFNSNPKIFIFILSTRSGGVGMNLTGADTVIFYDSDWNPAMDAQAQDRCHRIGQTREVHIYRLVSERTIEENILHKSDQKRRLDHLAIQSGGFNTEHILQKFNPRELLGLKAGVAGNGGGGAGAPGGTAGMSEEEVAAALRSVEDEGDAAAAAALERETAAELAEFSAEPNAAPGGDAEADDEDADVGEAGGSGREDGASQPSGAPSSGPSCAPPSAPPPAMPDTAGLGEVAVAGAEEDEMMADVAALAGGGSGGDALATLEGALRPIERYAVRLVEEMSPPAETPEVAAAAVTARLETQEWNMQEIERIQEEQEAEMEEDAEAVRAVDWDRTAADAAYRAEVERAQARARLVEEQLGTEYDTPTETAGTSRAGWGRSARGDEAQSSFGARRGRGRGRRRGAGRRPARVKREWAEVEEEELDDSVETSEDDAALDAVEDAPSSSGGEEADAGDEGSYAAGWRYARPNGASARQSRMASSPPLVLAPFKRPRTQLHNVPRQRSRLGEPATALGLSWDTSAGAGGGGAPTPAAPFRMRLPLPPLPPDVLRAPTRVWKPWEPGEDCVLVAVAAQAASAADAQADAGQAALDAAMWQLASDTLAADAAALSAAAVAAPQQQSKRRSAQECCQRYLELLQAFRGPAMHVPVAADAVHRNGCKAAARHEHLRQQLARIMKAHGACNPQELAAAIAAASNGGAPVGGAAAAAVLQELHRLAAGEPPEASPSAAAGPRSEAVAVTGAEAAAMLEAVRKGAEPGSRGILRHLNAVLAAVRGGGVEAGRRAIRQLLTLPRAAAPGQLGDAPAFAHNPASASPLGLGDTAALQRMLSQAAPPTMAPAGLGPGILPAIWQGAMAAHGGPRPGPLRFLAEPTLDSEAAFLDQQWERKPVFFPGHENRRKALETLFTTAMFFQTVTQRDGGEEGPLEFGRDVNACRYVDGVRETPNEEVADLATLKYKYYVEGCTLQLHQPQRWAGNVARLVRALEAKFGCLVGANAYLTPPGKAGLAPHYDDVELFVCHTEGRKLWRLYSPAGGFELPSRPSGDLPLSGLGEPVFERVLEPGDVLYLPRGSVHAAEAVGDAGSCHITISTYQSWTLATLLQHMLSAAEQAQSEPICLPLELRRGLPPGFVNNYGLQVDAAGCQTTTATVGALAAGLRALADRIEAQPALLSAAADSLAADFMQSRLPPAEQALPPSGPAPTFLDSVRAHGSPGTFRLVPFQVEGREAADAAAAGLDPAGGFVKVLSCLQNTPGRTWW